MKKIKMKISTLFFLCALLAFSCNDSEKKTKQSITTTVPDLKQVSITLPTAPGSQTFNANCVICHSAALVSNQPDFPEKTWTAIVTKMQKTFGAPVSDSAAKIIIQYLVAVKGKS